MDTATRVIYPPRPKGRMNPTDLPKYENTGKWVAQRKFNGTRNLIHISPEGQVQAYGRYGEFHKSFVLDRTYQSEIISNLNLESGKEYWLDSEVLNKTTGAGGEIVFFDVLQAGRYLFGTSQMNRLKMLHDICNNPQEYEPSGIALQISDRLWLAETYDSKFAEKFAEAIDNPQIEGLVLRKKDSVLDNFGANYYEVSWQIRCRKPHKNYTF